MTRNYRLPLALSLVLTGLVCSFTSIPAAHAQLAPTFNNGAGEVLQQEQNQNKIEKLPPKVEEKAPEVKIDVPSPSANVQIDTAQIHANKIVLENVTILTPQEQNAIIQPYEGKDITLDDLQKIVDQINEAYRAKGFLTTQAFVPPQDVKEGVVTIRVAEGHVGDLCVTGNYYNRTDAILRNLDMRQGDAFNLKGLEHDLNHANQFSDNYRLRATLSPGAQTGETNVRIEETEKQPWQISPSFDNQGRPFIGTYRGGVELQNSSLFGWGDHFDARYLGASGTNVALGSYFLPINGWGDEIGVNYGYSRVNVDLDTPGAQPEIIGKAHTVGFSFSHPFDENRVWVGDINLYGRRILNFVDGVVDPARDDIRAFQVGLNYNKYDKWGRTYARLASGAGIGILGGNSEFWKSEGFLTRLFNLPWSNVLMLRFYGMYAPDALPSAEEMQIGGAYSVRGYSEGILIGDRGYNLTIEDRYPIPFLGNVSPWLDKRLQGAVFFDLGQVWKDRDNTSFVSNNSDNTLLAGAGVGLRARLSQYLQGFVDLGFGLDDRSNIEPKGNPTARIHFGLRSDLLPEVYKARNTKVSCAAPRHRKPRVNTIEQKMRTTETPQVNTQPAAEPEAPVAVPESNAQPVSQTDVAAVQPESAPVTNAPVTRNAVEHTGRVGVMSILGDN